jgi:membrane protease YdiL (CAAX protease family)
MHPDTPPERPPETAADGPLWTVGDFAIAVFVGIAGAFLAASVAFFDSSLGTVLIATLAGQYGGHLLGLLIVVRRRNATFSDLGLEVLPIDGIYLFFGIALQFAVVILFSPLALLLESEGSGQALADVVPEVTGTVTRTLTVLAMAFVVPIVEELLFRGLLFRIIDRWRGPAAAVFLSAFVFSIFHLLGLGMEDPLTGALLLVPQLLLVGVVLARQVQRRGRLGPSIFTHAGFNLVAVLVLLAAPGLLGT